MTTKTLRGHELDQDALPVEQRVYRTIGLSQAQIDRLPLWAKLAFARADASLIRADASLIRADAQNADLLEALKAASRALTAIMVRAEAKSLAEHVRYELIDQRVALDEAIAKAEGA